MKGGGLRFGLTSLDKDVAQELGKSKVSELQLNGLTSIDKDVAQELAKFKGECLNLFDLTSIDKDVARELAKFKGQLDLRGLTLIDKDAAQELAKFQGRRLGLDALREKARSMWLTWRNDGTVDENEKEAAQELAKLEGFPQPLEKKSEWLKEFERQKSEVDLYDLRYYVNGNRDFPIQAYQGVPTKAAIWKKLAGGKPSSYLGRVFPGYKLHKTKNDVYHVNFQTASLLEDGSWKLFESISFKISEEGKISPLCFKEEIYTPD